MKRIGKWVMVYGITAVLFLTCVHSGSGAVTAMSENRPPEKEWRIVIDAGHGGMDSGTTSVSGIPESQLNLEISKRLNDLFHLLGYHTEMTRLSEEAIHTEGKTIAAQKASDLKERVKIANAEDKTILLSIHQNHFSDSQYHGAQVFYAATPGSKELAAQMQNAISADLQTDNKRQPSKCKGIYLMEHIQCTGLLIECGFLSNIREEEMLRTKSYQQQLCGVIATVVAEFIRTNAA